MADAKPRSPRKLLIAGAGLAAISFGGGLAACGGRPLMGKAPVPCSGTCTGVGSSTTATTGGGGTTGLGVQYCGIPDGGVPIPCDQLDAGPDGGPTDGGPGDGG